MDCEDFELVTCEVINVWNPKQIIITFPNSPSDNEKLEEIERLMTTGWLHAFKPNSKFVPGINEV